MKIRIDPLDTLFSEFIRKRAMKRTGGCERCLTPKTDYKQLQCAHFHGRSKKSVRWDEDNAVGLCCGCHLYLDSHPLDKVEWFKSLLGEERFDLLNSRMRNMEKPDKKLLTIYFNNKLEELR